MHNLLLNNKNIYTGWGSLGSIIGGLFLFYINVSGIHLWFRLNYQPLTIPAPRVLLRVGWSIPMVSTLVIASHFLLGNRETDLKPTTFSSLLLFNVFLSFFSYTPMI